MSPQQFVWIAALFVFVASFKAWKRERDKNDARENFEEICVGLENLHARLLARIREIGSHAPIFYYERYPQFLYEKDGYDPDTERIIADVRTFLDEKLSRGYWVTFDDQDGMWHTPHSTEDWAFNRLQDTVDRLMQHGKQLRKIIERQTFGMKQTGFA